MAWTSRGLGSAGHAGAATESLAAELRIWPPREKKKTSRKWPCDDVPHSDFRFFIVIISAGLKSDDGGGWDGGRGGSAAFWQRVNDVFAALDVVIKTFFNDTLPEAVGPINAVHQDYVR